MKIANFQDVLLDRQLERLSWATEEAWDDVPGQIIVRGVGANDPTWKVFSGNFYGYAFEPSVKINECWVDFHVQHNINPVKETYIHVHWSPADAGAGVVRWGIELIHADAMTSFSTTRTIYLEDTAAGFFPYHQVIECGFSDAIAGSSLIPGAVIKARLFRDATHVNDTYAGDAFPHFLNLHCRVDRQGTRYKEGNLYAE